MLRLLSGLIALVGLIGCQKSEKKAEFKGVWIDKTLFGENVDHSNAYLDTLARFPLILFEKEEADSVLFFYEHAKRNIYPAEYSYNSYFIHFDKNHEYFLTYDYVTDEMVFSDLKGFEFHRFRKIKTDLTSEMVLSPSFKLDSLIRSSK